MKAMFISRFGGPEVFEMREIPTPAPGPGEVLVRIVASGTNPVEAKLRKDGTWAQFVPPLVLGYDASGVVEQAGPGVSDFKAGDEVFYTPEIFGNALGTYAEYNVVPAAIVAQKPRNLTHEEAAAIPLAGGTAYEAIVRRLAVKVGEAVLIHGASGGVGSFAVQLAKASGARVLATASRDNLGLLKELGADVAMDYKNEDVYATALKETAGAGVDAVFDVSGGHIPASLPITRPFGRLATILPVSGELQPLYTRNQTLHGIFLMRERARLDSLARILEQKRARPVIEKVLPLSEVKKAHERLDSGHAKGKIILKVS
jgi:NADPH2:quinone reductase